MSQYMKTLHKNVLTNFYLKADISGDPRISTVKFTRSNLSKINQKTN